MSEQPRAIFSPIFERIRAGAIERETLRQLPREEINWLSEAGFGRLRVPVSHGGFGLELREFFDLLIELGAADSNIVQALRGHIGFVEFVRTHPDPLFREQWFARLAAGALVGNAESERTGTFAEQATRIQKTTEGYSLTGTKYYTTGSIFADWIHVSAVLSDDLGDKLVTVQVPSSDPGVVISDDWDGFGQRLTGSGTTTFTDVPVDFAQITHREAAAPNGSILHATYQLVHLAALAGIAVAALSDTVDFVRQRTRNLFNPQVPATGDPVALQIIGEGQGSVLAVRSTVLAAAEALDTASRAIESGRPAASLVAAADGHVFAIQPHIIESVLRLTSQLFEVGGASAVSSARALDRHWRNARTISSHNPAEYRKQAVGEYVVNAVAPARFVERLLTPVPATSQS